MIALGDAVYQDPQTGKYKKAKANALATAHVEGLALTAAPNNAPFRICYCDDVTLGTAQAGTGRMIVLSDQVAGKLIDYEDLLPNGWVSLVGYLDTTTNLHLDRRVWGVQKAGLS